MSSHVITYTATSNNSQHWQLTESPADILACLPLCIAWKWITRWLQNHAVAYSVL